MSGYVLVVDDDPDIRELIQAVLDGYGFDASTARDGYEALRVLAARGPASVVLLDLRMPGMSGEELLPLLRQQFDGTMRVVVLSGDATARLTAGRLGADGFLAKPVGIQELIAAVEPYPRHTDAHAP